MEDEKEAVYDFDRVSEWVGRRFRKGKPGKSADALWIRNEKEFFLFEFKNTCRQHMPWKELHEKAYDSMIPLQLVFCPNISLEELAQRTVYIVVYHDNAPVRDGYRFHQSNSFEKTREWTKRLANVEEEPGVLWGLECFVNVFFKRVYTVEKEYFQRVVKQKVFAFGSARSKEQQLE